MDYRTMTVNPWKMALFVFVACALCFSAVAEEEGLVAYYPFEEGKGAIARDLSGHGNDGKIVGAAWATGPYGTALSFDGVDDFVDCGAGKSLSVGAAASVAFWFKPKASQGGLVGWCAGDEWRDQRLVTSYSSSEGKLIVRMSDGDAHPNRGLWDTQTYKGAFPPVDVWTHFAMTFDGVSVSIYRDGAFVDVASPEFHPDLQDVPMWIGKSLGLGASYFNGLIDEVRVYDREISDRRVLELYLADAGKRGKDAKRFNRVQVKATAHPVQGRIVVELDFRDMWPTPEGMTMEADLLNAASTVAAKSTVRMLPVWGPAEAHFNVPDLAPGEYTVRVVAKKPGGENFGEESRSGVTWTERPKAFSRIKVLNNLCWELLNVAPVDRPAAGYSFVNPRRGWVYFSTEAGGRLTLSAPGVEPSVIHDPANGALQQEAMRFLPEGEYTVASTGEGALKKLVARAVPTLMFCKVGSGAHIAPFGPYAWDFLEKDILRNTNSLVLGVPTEQQRQRWVDMGGRWVCEEPIRAVTTPETTTKDVYDFLTSLTGFTHPLQQGALLDEFGQGNEDYFRAWAEASEMVLSDPKYANRMVIPYCGDVMYDYERSSEFIRTLIRHGSCFAWERYLWEQPSEDKAWLYIRRNLADKMPGWEAGIPGATSHMIVCLGYMSAPPETLNVHPTVNFKVLMDMEFQHLATHPAFFGVGGIMEYTSSYSDEENIRWQGRLYRHYALEGNTERLSPDPYVLRHIQNPDFDRGTDGWTIEPAAPGSVQARNHEHYSYIQHRYRPTPQGDNFLWTKRSAQAPNIFSQRIKALKPGQLYSMKMITADYQKVLGEVSDPKQLAVSVRIKNAEMLTGPDKNFQFVLARFPPHLNYHWYVFRALGETAELVVSDWESDAVPGGPIGQEIMYNFIEIQPYLED